MTRALPSGLGFEVHVCTARKQNFEDNFSAKIEVSG